MTGEPTTDLVGDRSDRAELADAIALAHTVVEDLADAGLHVHFEGTAAAFCAELRTDAGLTLRVLSGREVLEISSADLPVSALAPTRSRLRRGPSTTTPAA